MKIILAIFIAILSLVAFADITSADDKKPERCYQPGGDAGLCLAYIPQFYYDATSNTCVQFIYGGCQGNNNRFDTKDECETICQVA